MARSDPARTAVAKRLARRKDQARVLCEAIAADEAVLELMDRNDRHIGELTVRVSSKKQDEAPAENAAQ